uniref:Anaphase-promoting complex subunit 4 WD40 domain-containing protein n=1 Tax=Guillardia theta TaxID=55529 RepID=A0A7S4KLK7_GUITH|mmetsp:Transcript_26916/g.88023  ORF Transcript_26916/g.88023 Transcript_26916/m.88023 type:complete len:337 (+) Transcript_26916:192-1202(+)
MSYSDQICNNLQQVRVFKDSNGSAVTSIDFSKDGRFLVSGSNDSGLRLYDAVETGSLMKTLYAKKLGIAHVRFTHANSAVLCASSNRMDHSIRYWSMHDNRYLRHYKGHRQPVIGLHVSPAGDTFLSASADSTVRLWDIRSDACTGMLRLPVMSARPNVAFDDKGLVFAVTMNSMINLYSTTEYDKGPFSTFSTDLKCAFSARSMKFSSDGKYLLLAGGSDTIAVVDSFTGNHVEFHPSEPFVEITDACMTPDCRYIVAGTSENSRENVAEGGLRIWKFVFDPDNQKVLSNEVMVCKDIHQGPVNCVECSPTHLLIATACKNLNYWMPAGQQLRAN